MGTIHTLRFHSWFSVALFIVMSTIVSSLRISPPLVDTYASLGSKLWWTCSVVDSVPSSAVNIVWRFGNLDLMSDSRRTVYSNGTMYISVVQSGHLGEYTCVARDSQTVTQAKAWLRLAYISQSAVIQPLVQSVRLGGVAILQCRVDAQPRATFDWTFEGSVVKSTSDVKVVQVPSGVSTVRITDVKYENAGRYSCSVSHVTLASPLRAVSSTLSVYGPPELKISGLPNFTLPIGYTVSFQCPVMSEPSSQVSWTFQAASLSQPVPLSSTQLGVSINATSGTLTLDTLAEDNSGLYTCTWTNQYGQISSTARLLVRGLPESPIFVQKPSDTTVVEGDDAIMNCSCKGNPRPIIEWSRTFGEVGHNREDKVEDSEGDYVDFEIEIDENFISFPLRIRNISRDDFGMYTCKIANKEGEINASAYLEVMSAPVFDTQPQSMTVREGERLNLACTASGNPQPSISWTLPDNSSYVYQEGETGDQEISVLEDGQLIIRYVARDNHGIFICSASNMLGTATVSVTVAVSGAPHFVERPVSLGSIEGDQVKLTCAVSASPPATVVWYYKYLADLSIQSSNIAGVMASITSPSGDLSVTNVTQVDVQQSPRYSLASDGSSILISHVKESDAGLYICHASNVHGSAFAVAVLRVISSPTFQISPVSSKVSIGESVQLDCYSIGVPVPTQRWLFQKRYLEMKPGFQEFTNGSLFIESVTEEDLGTYTCLATNQAGQRSVSAMLSLSAKPTFVLVPLNTTVDLTSNATLLCQGNSMLPLQVTWHESNPAGELLRLLYSGFVEKNTSLSQLHTPSTIFHYLEFSSNGNLILKCVDKETVGWYVCQLKNDEGVITSAPAYVDVHYMPDSLELGIVPSTPKEFQNATLTCKANGLPLPTLSWIMPSKIEVDMDSSAIKDVFIQPSVIDSSGILISSLVIQNAQSEIHGGIWMCKACNVGGCRMKMTEIHIQGVPHITKVTSEDAENEFAIYCIPSGSPSATVMYFSEDNQTRVLNVDGHRVQDNVMYVQKDQMRPNYWCSAENLFGISSLVRVSSPGSASIVGATPTETGIHLIVSTQIDLVSLAPTEFVVQYRKENEPSDWSMYSMPLEQTVDSYIPALNGVVFNESVLTCASSNADTLSRQVREIQASNNSSVSVTSTGSIFVYQIEVLLSNLDSNTVYNVEAMILNILGSGPPSLLTQVRTLSSAPSVVTNVQVHVEDLTVTVTWNNPDPLNGQSNDVKITVALYNASASPEILLEDVEISAADEPRVSFTVLHLGEYSLQISAANSRTGDVGETVVASFRVQQVPPSFVPEIEKILVMTSSSLEIHWSTKERNQDPNTETTIIAEVTGYRIKIERISGSLSSDSNRSFEIEIHNRSKSIYTAHDLLEHEEYSVRVAATNTAGRGAYSRPSTATTLYKAFSEKALDEEIPDIGIRWRLLAIILIVGFSVMIVFIGIILFSVQARLSKCKSVDLTPPQSSRGRNIEEEWMEIPEEIKQEEKKQNEEARTKRRLLRNNARRGQRQQNGGRQFDREEKIEEHKDLNYDASSVVLEGYPNDGFALY
ncbi:hemicentin-1 [Plakobranchus ocellatus]|uniref:Hemicentin-1 n=1 Tax=Plakobranchus ocellatus TaxID=259542 RepID=A0AAV4DX05_9GAST|nr:hemicentin-1 [Plakobranchus ocellatus]